MTIIRKPKTKQVQKRKLKSLDIEIAIADYYGIRQYTVIPNISWGLGVHECDLLIMSKSGYCTEVEIKVSKADLIKDNEKEHGHKSDKIQALFFAVPLELKDIALQHIPKHAGLFTIEYRPNNKVKKYIVNCVKPTTINKVARKLTDVEKLQFYRLGCMRIWGLKKKLVKELK